MIYILAGNDTNKKSDYIIELARGGESFFLASNVLTKEILFNYSANISIFGDSPIIIVESVLSDGNLILSSDELILLKESKTTFVFKEDKMLAPDQKKYSKYGEVKIFENKKIITPPKFNVFSITDSFANRDKVGTWVSYNNAIENGIEPEAIAGVIFWKIKNMILNGSRQFTKDELKNQSSSIVSLYHLAHRGESDFTIGLEQFILNSLSSR